MKLDLGGGSCSLTGFVNVDVVGTPDINLDLNKVGQGDLKFPWDDNSVDAVHSSHCFEHLTNIHKLWWEIARVLKPEHGAEIRVPHWANGQACMMGHVRTLSERDILQMYEFPKTHWGGSKYWLKLHRIQYVPSSSFEEAQRLFRWMNRLQIMQYVQDTCHELRFHFIAASTNFNDCDQVLQNITREDL